MKRLLILAALAVMLGGEVRAGFVLNAVGGSYSQNFNTLATTGTNNTWSNDSTISSWYLFDQGNTAKTSYIAGTGSITNGAFYSFGSSSSSDRALGGVGSSSNRGYIAFSVQNGTGVTLDSFTLTFDGEQWRNGGNTTAHTMQLQYGFGSTFAGVATWNSPGGTFNWTSPIATGTATALDGNLTANRLANRGGTISNLTWANGDTLFIRWVENDDFGSDHGLAIDNFQFSAVPEPTSGLLIGIGTLACFALRRNRRSA